MKGGGYPMRLHSHAVVVFAVLVGGSLLAMPGQGAAATAQATVDGMAGDKLC